VTAVNESEADTVDVYCAWCGRADAGTGDDTHGKCRARLAMTDPPRFCAHCARRMVVQVTPTGWRATCSRHGQLTST
jgi:hypothetical protein